MIIGISLVLMTVVIFMGVANYNREKVHMGEILREKGAALIWSFEAGAQAGMTGVFGSDARLQTLLEKTASRHDISYIALVDRNGVILAHNDKKMIGKSVRGFCRQRLVCAIGRSPMANGSGKRPAKAFRGV